MCLVGFVFRCSSFHTRWNVISSFPHRCIVCFEGLVKENEKNRFIRNIFSSAKQSKMKGGISMGDLLRASRGHALGLRGSRCYSTLWWGYRCWFSVGGGNGGKVLP